MQQAQDFRDESDALYALLSPLSDADFETPTLFKDWTINDILRHLYVWNIGVWHSLNGDQEFGDFLANLTHGNIGKSFRDKEFDYLDELAGTELLTEWQRDFESLADQFDIVDPKLRLKWVGPDMSAISSITARLMETWAHAQAVYDMFGVVRVDEDRIGNIVRLGVNTYGWTFKNRKEEPPGPMPRLRLSAPSGAVWEYGEGADCIEGSATEFCQVVTQCRNIADTQLQVAGPVAERWMAVAQCFAGPPQNPPPAGARHRSVK